MTTMFCRECVMTEDGHQRGCAFNATTALRQVLAVHQWEFDSRHFCRCGEAIRYTNPLLADTAMADHQLDAAERAEALP